MVDRLNFLVLYVGSAAMVAFLAACLSSPRVANYACDTDTLDGTARCELVGEQDTHDVPGAPDAKKGKAKPDQDAVDLASMPFALASMQ